MTFSEFVQDQRKPLPLAPTPEGCKGATFIVTGANTGLGFEAAKRLVALSSKKVILGVRSLKKGEEAKAKIEAETGIKGVAEVWHLDLTSHDSVKEFAKKVQELDRVDAVIENAGVAMGEWTTAEGLETTLTVNDVSTMLLAALVLPKLQKSGRKFGISPHLVVVGSAVAFGAEGELERIDGEGDILEGLNQPMVMGKR
jgi:NAD(P)-dependent dehydrogenase (short-subunit alcohol dehydrogenase family)